MVCREQKKTLRTTAIDLLSFQAYPPREQLMVDEVEDGSDNNGQITLNSVESLVFPHLSVLLRKKEKALVDAG